MSTDKRQLCIGSNRNVPESYLMCQVHHIVYVVWTFRIAIVSPQIEFTTLEVHKPGTLRITVFQFFANLCQGLYAWSADSINRTVFAPQIALIQDEDDRLQRSLPATPRTQLPPG
jgi:hypothetical protein